MLRRPEDLKDWQREQIEPKKEKAEDAKVIVEETIGETKVEAVPVPKIEKIKTEEKPKSRKAPVKRKPKAQ